VGCREKPRSHQRSIRYAEQLDCETIQFRLHMLIRTEFDSYSREQLLHHDAMTDELGHQLPNIEYPG